MLVKFQLSDEALASMLRARFQRQGLCVTDPIVGGPNPTYIDHIEFSGTTPLGAPTIFEDGTPQTFDVKIADGSTRTVTCPTLVMNRVVTVYTTTMNDLKAAHGGSVSVSEVFLPLKFSLTVQHVDFVSHQPLTDLPDQEIIFDQLTIAYYGLGAAVSDEVLAQVGTTRAALDAQLKTLLPPASTQLDLAGAISQLGAGSFSPASVWSGIASTQDFLGVEIRIELASGGAKGVADAVSWDQFYNHQFDELVADQDWALFLDKDLLVGIVAAKMTPAIKKTTSFRLESGPSFSWNVNAPGVVASFNGDMINACQCVWGKIDVNADVTVTVSFSVDQGDLRTDVRLSHSANGWQLLCCELTAALFWPVLGLSPDYSWGEYFGGLAIGPGNVFIKAIEKASSQTTSVSPPAALTADPNDPDHYFSEVSVTSALGQSPDDVFTLAAVVGDALGLILRGGHTDRQLKPATIETSVQQFMWSAPSFSCSGLTGEWDAHAEIVVTKATGDLDFAFCSATVDPPEYQPYLSTTYTYFPYSAIVNLDVPKYLPESPTVFVQTSGGLRFISLDPMPQLTDQEIQDFREYARRWRLENCYTLLDPWFNYFHQFNPKWLVDPPYDGDWYRLWILAVAGIDPGDLVNVGDSNGGTVVTAVASASGTVEVSAFANSPELVLTREPSRGREPGAGSSGKAVSVLKEVLLERLTSFRASAPIFAIQGVHTEAGPTLLVATVEGLDVLAIDGRGQVFPSRARVGGPLAGAARVAGRLVGWSASGVIVDLSASSRALAPDGLEADMRRRLEDTLAAGATNVILEGSQFLAESGGVIRWEDGRAAITTDSVVSRVTTSSTGVLVGLSDGRHVLYRLKPEAGYELVARYPEQPWFAGSTNLGQWLAIIDRDTVTIDILRIADERVI